MRKTTILFFSIFILYFGMCFTSANALITEKPNNRINTVFSPNNGFPATCQYLIITNDSFISTLEPLSQWKAQRGLSPYTISVQTITGSYTGIDTAAKIKNCIADFYYNHSTIWVLLAGDVNVIPTRYVNVEIGGDNDNTSYDGEALGCDYYYADLNNNWDADGNGIWTDAVSNSSFDWIAEVYVGRLPAKNVPELQLLVTNIINYEKTPIVGSWLTNTLFAGAFANFDTDNNGNHVFDVSPPITHDTGTIDWPAFDANRWSNWVLNRYQPITWSRTLLAETAGVKATSYPYNISLSSANLITAVNAGVGAAMFSGHGSYTGVYRTYFDNDADSDSLVDPGIDSLSQPTFMSTGLSFSPDNKLGFYYINACNAGTFNLGIDCVSEYILRTIGIGCIAAFKVSWYEDNWHEERGVVSNATDDHGGWYNEGLAARFWEQFFNKSINHPAKALALARANFKADRNVFGQDEWYIQDDWNTRVMTQYNLMGDPEVPIWTKIPQGLGVSVAENSPADTRITVQASQPVSGITVTLMNSTFSWTGVTDNNGQIIVNYPLVQLTNLILTASSDAGIYIPCQLLLNGLPLSEGLPISSLVFITVVVFGLYIKRQKIDKWIK